MRYDGRAIHALIFLGGLVAPVGCSPDLSRQAAPLVIRALGLPDDATDLRATITGHGSTYHLESPVPIFIQTGELVAESVPVGEVAIVAEAVTPRGTLVTSATALVATPLTRALVDFNGQTGGADGGVLQVDGGASPEQRDSSPIPHVVVVNQTSISDHILTASVPAKSAETDPYPQLLGSLATAFGRPPAAISVKSVSVGLLSGTQVRVSNLRNVFDEVVSVALVPRGGAAIEVAAGEVDEGGGFLDTFGSRAVLAPIQSALTSGDFDIRVRGPSRRGEGGDTFSAAVRVRIVYTAYDR